MMMVPSRVTTTPTQKGTKMPFMVEELDPWHYGPEGFPTLHLEFVKYDNTTEVLQQYDYKHTELDSSIMRVVIVWDVSEDGAGIGMAYTLKPQEDWVFQGMTKHPS